jgi:Matrixin
MRALATRVLGIAITLMMCVGTASAYYFFVHYNSRTGPFFPIVEKFDLNSLQNNTVYFYISDAGPSALPPGDSFQAFVSEIRPAADKWNAVATSALRIQYGGLYNSASGQVNAGITVEFSNDLPPGVLALGGPVTNAGGSNGQFIPILRSTVRVQSDLSQPQTACSNSPCPSYSEYFFTTMVHEFGHALGLQHTFTSAVMSTAVTSAATKAVPLSADDIAGISLLYPAPGFGATVGSIGGRVTVNGSGVSLASVVAISTGNPAISTITNPDGTYQIDGLPPGAYQVYVHPLPPRLQTEDSPGNVVAPRDPGGNPFPFPSTAFQTQFYNGAGGTQDFLAAGILYVNPGSVNSGVNFQVRSKAFPSISSVRTYGYSTTNVPITSPPVSTGTASLVAYGAGLLQNANTLTPGLNVSVLGSGSSGTEQIGNLAPWVSGYIRMYVTVGAFSGNGAKHLLFSTKDDIYVLPSGFSVVSQQPPSIASVAPAVDNSGNRVLEVTGTNLAAGSTTILFDGLPGTVTGAADDGGLFVIPPPGPGSYRAIVTALNPDGQSSNFLQPAVPPVYTYDPSAAPALAVSPALLAPGSNVIDVVATNTNFIDGQVMAGFGSSDAVVTKVTVVSPTHLLVGVTMNSNTIVSTTSMNVVNGLQLIAQSQGSNITLQPPPSGH